MEKQRFDATNINRKLINYANNIVKLKLQILTEEQLKDEIIEMICLGSVKLTDMPQSITNKFRSLTEQAVLMLTTLEDMEKKELIKTKSEIIEISVHISRLPQEDIFLIESYIEKITINAETWEDISKEYTKRFDKYITVRNIYYRLYNILLPWLEKELQKGPF
jgi:hypothetical protein